jgi:hypothetical protein
LEVDREKALELLAASHSKTLTNIGIDPKKLITAGQVHGNIVVRVDARNPPFTPDCDGLLTNDPSVALGIYTADCGAIFLVDPDRRAIGLLHSGKKGTELGILSHAIRQMQEEFGSQPSQLIVQLAPCIRPPHYEVDFAAQIAAQAAQLGVKSFQDCGACTASDPEKYYSYRRELGKTGRHLSVLGYAG